MITAPAEKKQLASVTQAYDVLTQQTSRGELAPETLQKVNNLVDALSNRNFSAASQIQAVRSLPHIIYCDNSLINITF